MAPKEERQEVWEQAWGKVDYFSDKFAGLISMLGPQLGKVIVDIGSGATPVTKLLDRNKHKVIEIDLASDGNPTTPNTLRLRFDIEDAIDNKKDSTRKAISKAANFLNIDSENCDGSPQKLEQVDTFVLSQILHYVDFKAVIKSIKKYLKPGGQIILNECFNFGIEGLISENGLSNFQDLSDFVRDEGYEISEPRTYDNRLVWKLTKPKNHMQQEPSLNPAENAAAIAAAKQNILAARQNLYTLGGNHQELADINDILVDLEANRITPEDAMAKADAIINGKNSYH